MKYSIAPVLLLLLSAACGMFSKEDEAMLQQAITEAVAKGDISPEKAVVLRDVLNEVQNPNGWQEWALGILGVAGAYLGLRIQQTKKSLDTRPRTLPDPADVELLKTMLAEKKATLATPPSPVT